MNLFQEFRQLENRRHFLGRGKNLMGHAALASLLGGTSARGLAEALAVPGAHVHLYGKDRSAAGRKLGHVTATGTTVAAAEAAALRSAGHLHFSPLA